MLWVVPTPIGNLEDITLRALRILKEVDVILAEDTRTTGNLLKRYEIKAALESFHIHNEHARVKALGARLADGLQAALVSDAGTPGISDPGFLLIREALRLGISVSCLPGPTAFVPALVASGLPCERFIFEGFLPVKKGRRSRIESIAQQSRTVVLYESPHRAVRLVHELQEVLEPEREVCLAREISKIHETYLRMPIAELARAVEQAPPKGEIVMLIAPSASKNVPDD